MSFLPAPGQSATPWYHLHYNSNLSRTPPITSHHLPFDSPKSSHLSRLHLLKTSAMQLLGLRQLPPTASQRTNQPTPNCPRYHVFVPSPCPFFSTSPTPPRSSHPSYAKADAAPKSTRTARYIHPSLLRYSSRPLPCLPIAPPPLASSHITTPVGRRSKPPICPRTMCTNCISPHHASTHMGPRRRMDA